jgi:hypothetical protein
MGPVLAHDDTRLVLEAACETRLAPALRRLVDAGMPADRITTIHLGVDSAAFFARNQATSWIADDGCGTTVACSSGRKMPAS